MVYYWIFQSEPGIDTPPIENPPDNTEQDNNQTADARMIEYFCGASATYGKDKNLWINLTMIHSRRSVKRIPIILLHQSQSGSLFAGYHNLISAWLWQIHFCRRQWWVLQSLFMSEYLRMNTSSMMLLYPLHLPKLCAVESRCSLLALNGLTRLCPH